MTRFHDIRERGQTLDPVRCHFCDIEMIDGQCPECFSIELTELWRRQDMAEMLSKHEGLTECKPDPLKHIEPKRAA